MMSPSEQKINEVGRRAQENANLSWTAANSLFGALGHYVILMQYTPGKPCCQAIFPISGRFFCQAPAFVAHPVPCSLCAFWVLLFEFCTFSPKTPLCILYRFALVLPGSRKGHPA